MLQEQNHDHNRRLSVASLVNPQPPPTAIPSHTPTAAMASPTTSIIDAHDEKVLIAVSALGDMRDGGTSSGPMTAAATPYWHAGGGHSQATSSSLAPTPSLSHASTSSRATSPSALTRSDDGENEMLARDTENDESPDHLLARVSNLPLVNTALRAYDYGKANSRVINYGAGLVESSVKTISRPVIDRLPVDQLDEFACRQLDRLGRYGGKIESPESPEIECRGRDRTARGRQGSMSSSVSGGEEPTRTTASEDQNGDQDDSQRQVQVANRKGWQTVLVEASGIGAAISEENMKRLKYCLQWLQYATAHIDQQMAVLQRFLASLDSQMSDNPGAVVPMTSMRTLTDVKRDVVATVRQVVEVMSKYAGGALPEQARATVRNIILLLPERWANAMQQQEADMPSDGPSTSAPGSGSELSATTAQRAAKRVLTLAMESLEMMRGATGVFSESLERAEAWVERLRIIGIQRQRQHQQVRGHLPPGASPNSPGVNIQGLSLAASSSSLRSRKPSHSAPGYDEDDDDTETECASSHAAFSRGTIRRRQRRRIASPSPAATARLNGSAPGMQVDA